MNRHATFRMTLPSQRQVEVISKALEPETRQPPTHRSRASLEKKGGCLVLKIDAKDTVALRATANAYLRWIDSLTNILDFLDCKYLKVCPYSS